MKKFKEGHISIWFNKESISEEELNILVRAIRELVTRKGYNVNDEHCGSNPSGSLYQL